MSLAADHLAGPRLPTESLKGAYVRGLNYVQRTNLNAIPNDIFVDFDDPSTTELLVERTVFSKAEVLGNSHILTENERSPVVQNIRRALKLVAEVDPNLLRFICNLIGTVGVYKIDGRDGGSVSCCIGFIWLSPRSSWPIEQYAEMLVHESVHNSVFLEDMVRGIMPEVKLLEREDALTVSTIRRSRRPFDKAFHSACVACAIMYLHQGLGNKAEANRYIHALKATIAEMRDNDEKLRQKGLNLLSDNGRRIVCELEQFAEHLRYDVVSEALATQPSAAL